jgi:hypothetical protein
MLVRPRVPATQWACLTFIAMQDLLKRLLQKDPNKRLSFQAFFTHPFLSGEPLQVTPCLDAAPHVIVEEPSSHFGTIEDDYVILSIPVPPGPSLEGLVQRGAAGREARGSREGVVHEGDATSSGMQATGGLRQQGVYWWMHHSSLVAHAMWLVDWRALAVAGACLLALKSVDVRLWERPECCMRRLLTESIVAAITKHCYDL